jgi:2-amino-4-hydroxy-6-hydroxymethyldihydropteridine diphosphokinase
VASVFIGLGSNLGDRLEQLGRALDAIAGLPETAVCRVSEVVETEPWGVEDQPRFANAVALVETGLLLDELLRAFKDIERTLGRESGVRYGPRPIDLDILLADDEWHSRELRVPHPRLAERQFALFPLLEIAPDATWPDGTPFDRSAATDGAIVKRLGPVRGYERLTVYPLGE